MTTELLNCPFCGCTASERADRTFYTIICDNYKCGAANGVSYPEYKYAVAHWNRRASTQPTNSK